MPFIAGLSMASASEIMCGIFNITDEGFYWKSSIEVVSFAVAFVIAQRMQDMLRIVVTSFFGSFLILIGGCIIFDKLPSQQPVKVRRGQKEPTVGDQFIKYLPYMCILAALTAMGIYYQRKNMVPSE